MPPFLEILQRDGRNRRPLSRGSISLGGLGADLPFEGFAGEAARLEISDEGARLVRAASGPALRVNGLALEEADLADGDEIVLGEVRMFFRHGSLHEREEERPAEPSSGDAGAPTRGADRGGAPKEASSEEIARAACVVLAGAVDPARVRRWSDSLGPTDATFDAAGAARDLLEGVGGPAAKPGTIEARALREALLARAARRGRFGYAAKRAAAGLVARLLFFLLYTAAVVGILLVLRRGGLDIYRLVGF